MKQRQLTRSILLLANLFFWLVSVQGQSSEGKDFWFSFMEHRDVGINNKVVMITSESNTSGLIEIPFYNFSENFTVQPNQVTIVPLPSYTENLGSGQISDKGIHLSSNDPVSVYLHQYYSARSEAHRYIIFSLILCFIITHTNYFSSSFSITVWK